MTRVGARPRGDEHARAATRRLVRSGSRSSDDFAVHVGTGSPAGSSAGAGTGTGSSSGVISISRSVSGAPMSITASLSYDEVDCLFGTSEIGNSRQKVQRGVDGGRGLFPRGVRPVR